MCEEYMGQETSAPGAEVLQSPGKQGGIFMSGSGDKTTGSCSEVV